MADRLFKEDVQTPYKNLTLFPLVFQPAGTGAPTLGEGDPNSQYFTPARTGVGTYTLKTKNPWPNQPVITGQVLQGTPAFNTDAIVSAIAKNADNTWTISFTVFVGGVAADFANAAAGYVMFHVSLRNSGTTS